MADPVLAIHGPQGERTPENYPPGIKHAGFMEKFGMVGQPTEAPKWGPACGTVLPETRATPITFRGKHGHSVGQWETAYVERLSQGNTCIYTSVCRHWDMFCREM